MFLWEWTHFNPWYILKYNCNCHVKKWSSCTKKGFPPFSPHTHRRIDIVITINRFRTLGNVVIVDPTHINLVQQASMTTTHWATVATQDKEWSYTKWVLRNDFIPLAIKTYNCLHPHFGYFLSSCVHASIACHQQTSLVPSMLIFYFKQQMSIAFQRAQAITIFQQVATLSHNSSSLPHILTNAPASLIDLW